MKFTDRLGLRKPDQDDAYQVDDFNYNYQKISEAFTGVPRMTTYETLEDFINSGGAADMKRGDTVAISHLIYIMTGSNPLNPKDYMVYGAEALVVMHDYIDPSERIKGSLYLQLGNTRRLIIKVFHKFFRNLATISGQTIVENGATFLFNSDGSITVTGTTTAYATVVVGKVFLKANETYALKGGISNDCRVDLRCSSDRVVMYHDADGKICESLGDDRVFTNGNTDVTVYVVVRVEGGKTFDYEKVYPRVSVVDGNAAGDLYTMYFKETTEKTSNVADGNKYRFCCKNITVIHPGENPERVEGKLYLVVDSEETE